MLKEHEYDILQYIDFATARYARVVLDTKRSLEQNPDLATSIQAAMDEVTEVHFDNMREAQRILYRVQRRIALKEGSA